MDIKSLKQKLTEKATLKVAASAIPRLLPRAARATAGRAGLYGAAMAGAITTAKAVEEGMKAIKAHQEYKSLERKAKARMKAGFRPRAKPKGM